MGLNHVLVKLSGLYARCLNRRDCRGILCDLSGLRESDLIYVFESALILAIVVLGGMGSTLGVVLAALCSRSHRSCCAVCRVPGPAVWHADGGDDDLASTRFDPH
jgi:hypothetical protein